MDNIGILYQTRIPESEEVAWEISHWLEDRGVQTWVGAGREDGVLDENAADMDLLIVLGGDGTTLRAARMLALYDTPIFGVNMGRVGFLSEAQPDEWPEKLTRVLDGKYWVERRLRMHADLMRDGELVAPFTALNDVVVGRGSQARVIRLHLRVDGDLVTTYVADALDRGHADRIDRLRNGCRWARSSRRSCRILWLCLWPLISASTGRWCCTRRLKSAFAWKWTTRRI